MLSIVGWVTCEKAILLMSPFILSNAIKLAGEKIVAIRRAEADAGRAGVKGRAGIAGVAILGHFHRVKFTLNSLSFLSIQCLAKI